MMNQLKLTLESSLAEANANFAEESLRLPEHTVGFWVELSKIELLEDLISSLN